MTAVVLHAVVGLIIGGIVVAAYRSLRSEAPLCAAVMGVGFALRALIGLSLFSIAYFDLPVARSLHYDGFWTLAIDARTYYHIAADAAANGMDRIPRTGIEAYVWPLGAWIRAVGDSPAAGFFLNAVSYALACWLVISTLAPTSRNDRLAAFVLATFSFSPAILVWGSQPLKDEIFAELSVCVAALIAALVPALVGRVDQRRVAGWQFAALCVFVWQIAWIRNYYAIILVGSLAAILLCGTVLVTRGQRTQYVAKSTGMLLAMWLATMLGGGELYSSNIGVVRGALVPDASRRSATTVIADTRAGFDSVEGGTSLVRRHRPHAGGSGRRYRIVPGGVDAGDLILGVGAVVVPISALRALGAVDFSGGKGLLFITDVDTLYIDATLLIIALVLYGRRQIVRANWRVALPLFMTGAAMVLLVGAVVTNFGTLFRMRIMAVVPLWALTLAALPPPGAARTDRIGTPVFSSHG